MLEKIRLKVMFLFMRLLIARKVFLMRQMDRVDLNYILALNPDTMMKKGLETAKYQILDVRIKLWKRKKKRQKKQ